MCYGRRALNITDVRVRVAKGLNVNEFRVRTDGSLESIVVVGVDERCVDAISAKGVLQQVVCTTIDSLRRHNMVAGIGEIGYSIGDSSGT